MALGPKAMGEAIIANLKTKTGRDLAGWQDELRAAGVTDPGQARQHLKAQGLGQFQAITVVESHFGTTAYTDDALLIDDQFLRFPSQRALYDHAISALDSGAFTPPTLPKLPPRLPRRADRGLLQAHEARSLRSADAASSGVLARPGRPQTLARGEPAVAGRRLPGRCSSRGPPRGGAAVRLTRARAATLPPPSGGRTRSPR